MPEKQSLESLRSPSTSRVMDEKTSALLERLVHEFPGEEVSVSQVVSKLRRRSFGGLFFLLALLGLLPGISLLAGIAMIVPAFQLMIGFRAPRFPKTIRNYRISTKSLSMSFQRLIPLIRKNERFVKPRWPLLVNKTVMRIIGFLALALSFVIMVPLPFSNFLPALALLCLSLGVMERDGLLILFGMLGAVLAILVGIVVSWIAIGSALQFMGQ